MDLNALKDFLAVVSNGGFSQAGRVIGMPKSSLSRRVRELEDELGVRLLERTTRNMRLTPEGTALYERASHSLAELSEIESEIRFSKSTPKGPLRISAPTLMGHVTLGQLAAKYISLYPQVDLDIVINDCYVDLIEENFDAVIGHLPNDPNPALVGRRILRERMHLVASPTITPLANISDGPSKKGHVSYPAVLLGNMASVEPWVVIDRGERRTIFPHPVLRLPSMIMVRNAIRAGAGAALLPAFMALPDIETGRLISLGQLEKYNVEIWILHSSRRLVSNRLRAFIDLLIETFPEGEVTSGDAD